MIDEAKTRLNIDGLLKQCGFILQDMSEFNRFAKSAHSSISGVAVREFEMNDKSRADYLLFIEGKACGVIEAKREGKTLSSTNAQSKHYATHLPPNVKAWDNTLPFLYESNGSEIFFTNLREPNATTRRIFAFHSPLSLLEILEQEMTLRQRLQAIPHLDGDFKHNLRPCQIEAIEKLEESLSSNKPRALIQMATGAGKTFTSCNFIYRLLAYAKAKRVLFLVDRNNLGEQAKKEFDNFILPKQNRKFSDVYITKHLQNNLIESDDKLIITTIQRLYSLLKGEAEFDVCNEEFSAFDSKNTQNLPPKELKYNPNFPIDFFDFIIVDECHRSIYGEWRQVLEYFDAFIIGLSATPSKHTLGFFRKNLVSQYALERSIADGVNVGFEIFRIKTEVSEKGGKIEADFSVPVRDKRTRKEIYESFDEDIIYQKDNLDKTVLNPNQIRTILECYKDSVFTQLFPERKGKGEPFIPKTLVFAKDDNHAEEIVRLAREVFSQGNEFCQKITYRVDKQSPKDLIKAFRNDPKFRIAVTVDMIATGTDIKPLEVLIFMRDVKSKNYYEQMLGRGVRTIDSNDLRAVTPNAVMKTHFYVIDAVGVTESIKTTSTPLERKRGISLKELLEAVAKGADDENTLSSLADRLRKLALNAKPKEQKMIKKHSKGKDLHDLSNALLQSIDSDFCEGKSKEQIQAIKDESTRVFCEPLLRQAILAIDKSHKIIIDETTPDRVIFSQSILDNANASIQNFKNFINENKDEIEALSIIYYQTYKKRHLTRALIDELYDKLKLEKSLSISILWNAYFTLHQNSNATKGRVKAIKSSEEKLTNLIQLVRFALEQDTHLQDFGGVANSRFELFKGRQIRKGVEFSPTQLEFLTQIKDYIIANAYLAGDDYQGLNDACSDTNGIFRAKALFGESFTPLLEELNLSLISGLVG